MKTFFRGTWFVWVGTAIACIALQREAWADFFVVDNKATASDELVGGDFNDVYNRYDQQENFLLNTDQPVSATINDVGGVFSGAETTTGNTFAITTSFRVPTLPNDLINVGFGTGYLIVHIHSDYLFTLTTTANASGPDAYPYSGGQFYDSDGLYNIQDNNAGGTNVYTGRIYAGDEFTLSGNVSLLQINVDGWPPLADAFSDYSMVLTLQEIPEPSSLTLLGCGAVSIFVLARFRRRFVAA